MNLLAIYRIRIKFKKGSFVIPRIPFKKNDQDSSFLSGISRLRNLPFLEFSKQRSIAKNFGFQGGNLAPEWQ
ncbi:hypothetical protein A0128_11765 [Leptospira tipperaryensis]|uniref:Uncharacterized protein n=1 Tax=Leptospira tipperaryensis TaxID=2564040 RepID=A0A1D7UY14_9LEPT|nr:hypothetical protein A0128_11765 [Leptospira tipperaryensis]